MTTTDFHDTIRQRSQTDTDFRISLLETVAESVVSGDLDEGKAALRLYVKSTIGYEKLAALVGIHPKSLVRMLGSDGNPRASNLVALLAQTLQLEGIRLKVKATNTSKRRQTTNP